METVITDDDIAHIYPSEHDSKDVSEPTGYSKTIMAAYRKAKRVSKIENKRARHIVQEMREVRERMETTCQPKSTYTQQSILEY